MARLSHGSITPTPNPKTPMFVLYFLTFLLGCGLISLVVVFMAGGGEGGSGSKAKKKRPAKRQRGRSADPVLEEFSAEDEDESRSKWVRNMPWRGFKSERQVDMPAMDREKYGLHHIENRGITHWFNPLAGYNAPSVIQFYQNMEVVVDVPNRDRCVRAKINNRAVVITPNGIANYLGYARPWSHRLTYPTEQDLSANLGEIVNTLYVDPSRFDGNWVPGCYKEDCRFINKILCANLYPRCSEHKPGYHGAELVYVFVNPDHTFDIADFIFNQIVAFQTDQQDIARMPFPCMITDFVKRAGVMGPAFAKLTKPMPGPLTLSSWNKSEAQLRGKKGKGKEEQLLEEPGPKAKQETWFRKIWKMCAHLVKENTKLKKKRKEDRKLIARQAHKIDWMHARHSDVGSYVPPPDYESDESNDDEMEEDEGIDPETFMEGFRAGTTGHPGASGSGAGDDDEEE